MSTLEEIEERREERRKARAKQRLAQYAIDVEALDAAEETYGPGLVKPVELAPDMYFDGLPTMAIVRIPARSENTRYFDQIKNAKQDASKIVAASHTLGHSCVVYPPKEVYAQLLEKVDHFHARVAAQAVKLGQGGAEQEGKG